MPNNTRLKHKLNIIHNFQYAIKIEAFTKQMLKKYLGCELKNKKKKKILGNIYYISSLSSMWLINNLNNKFKQKRLKFPTSPKLGIK